jgi:hypothetical protein
LYILKKYHGYDSIPLDTTHLPIAAPYYFHKLLRVPRFILNIGYYKKVPFFQKGDPPSYRTDPYLNPKNQEFRDFVKSLILKNDIFDKKRVTSFFKKIESIKKFDFFVHHRDINNLYLLFRLAYAAKTP